MNFRHFLIVIANGVLASIFFYAELEIWGIIFIFLAIGSFLAFYFKGPYKGWLH